MTRLILREVARWGRALSAPFAVLAIVVVAPAIAPSDFVSPGADPALSAAGLAATIASLAWLLTSATRAALQPARDRRAFERLQDLRVRSGLPDHALLCILRTVWSTPAGERANAVDVRTGALVDLWLNESNLSDGSYALVSRRGGALLLVEAMPPGLVRAAQRHGRRDSDHRRGRTVRRARRAAAHVIHEAELLLK